MRILIVEDEREMANILREGLEDENHSVSIAFDGRDGVDFAMSSGFDAIILDLMLPRLDGFEVVRRLRKHKNLTPILVLTARDSVEDIERTLDLGADDYLTKPFSFTELLARLRAVARRGSSVRPPLMTVADLVLDPAAHRVSRGSHEIRLSPTEYKLLELLMRCAGRIVTRNAILEGVWGMEQDIEENTLDAFVRLLRSKVDKDYNPKLIQTVRGFGYSVCKESKS
jgi:two-component system, OmpR family, response regulator